ncbi:hypothetical protein HYR54_09175 [Candidatus Acetothermia bacterium]|nr:hypothetical protein [Candidatus Acetothermia bacterium]
MISLKSLVNRKKGQGENYKTQGGVTLKLKSQLRLLVALLVLATSTALAADQASSFHVMVEQQASVVRFSVQGANAISSQVEVFSLNGSRIFDSGIVSDRTVAWAMTAKNGRRIPNGVYMYAVTTRDHSGHVQRKKGKIVVRNGQTASVQQTSSPPQVENGPTQAMGPARLEFVDKNGQELTKLDLKSPIFLRLIDPSQNVNPRKKDKVTVIVRSVQAGDQVSVTLKETGKNTGEFRGKLKIKQARVNTNNKRLEVSGPDDKVEAQFNQLTATLPKGINIDKPGEKAKVTIGPNTQILDDKSSQNLMPPSADTETLVFTQITPALQNLKPGDIVAIGITDSTPNGLLRKVKAVRTDNGQVQVDVEKVAFNEAFPQGHISVDRDLIQDDVREFTPMFSGITLKPMKTRKGLTPDFTLDHKFSLDFDNVLYDRDGNKGTTDDQVRISGSVELTPFLVLDADWSCCSPVPDYFKASIGFRQSSHLRFDGKVNFAFNKSVNIAHFKTYPLGGFFTVEFTLQIGVDGNLSATASFDVNQDLTLAACIEYKDSWDNCSQADANLGIANDVLQGNVSVFGYVGFHVYLGVLYEFAAFKGTLRLGPKIEAQYPGRPRWKLSFCVDFPVKVTLDFLIDEETVWRDNLFNWCKHIQDAPNSPPSVRIISPRNGDNLAAGNSVYFQAQATDAEDGDPSWGNACCGSTFTWTSDRDGIIDTSRSYTFTTPGSRVITVTVRDSDGAEAKASVTVNVTIGALKVTIYRPTSGESIVKGQAYLLRGGGSYDANAGLELPCDRLQWKSNVPADPLPLTGCSVPVTFTSSGPRTITLTGIDAQGASAQATVNINVIEPKGTLPPVVQIVSPDVAVWDLFNAFCPSGPPCSGNKTISLIGKAADPDGKKIVEYRWALQYWDSSSNSWVIWKTFGTSPSVTVKFDDFPCFVDFNGDQHRLLFSATDEDGQTGSDYVGIKYSCVP